MDTPDENTAVSTRPLFGHKTALATVENTQTEARAEHLFAAMAAEADEQSEATTDVVIDTPVVEHVVEQDVADEAIPADTQEAVVEVDNTTVENLPSEPLPVEHDQTNEVIDGAAPLAASEEPASIGVDTDTETAVAEAEAEAVTAEPAGEVAVADEDLAEAQAETEAALTGGEPAPVEAEDEQATEEDTTAVDVSEVLEPAPAAATGKTVEELQAERDALDNEIKTKQDTEKNSVIAQIKVVVDTYGITTDELVEALGGLKSKRKGVKAKPKYRDPATGVIWSGRGKAPAWIKGKKFEDFLITE